MRVIGITGKKNTGKTTLVTMIISELKKRGFKVGTVKKTHSEFDVEGRDTQKHSAAGAEIVAGVGKETFFKINETVKLDDVLKFIEQLKHLDFIILEGFKKSPYIKIATANYTNSDKTIIKLVNMLKIKDNSEENSISKIVDLIEEKSYGLLQKLNCKKCGYNTCEEFREAKIKGIAGKEVQCLTDIDTAILKVDGEIIPMNPFVKNLVKNITTSLVESLRTNEFGVKSIEKIELIVKNEDTALAQYLNCSKAVCVCG